MSSSPEAETVEDYRFRPGDLSPESRLPGISAFMRIKNGAGFLEATIRSHMPEVDEVVAVYNQCTDQTPEILARLAHEFAPKLRVFHYLPKVHAPGSEEHAREPPDSPASFVNQSNFALSRTRFRVAVKLDDDHLAMPGRIGRLVRRIRRSDYRLPGVLCFAGINLARNEAGAVGVLAAEPMAGAGDHFFFEVTRETHFIHDLRFEDFDHGGKRREFADITYWHLKHLKPDFGFANRDLASNPRFARKRERFLSDRRVIPLSELPTGHRTGLRLLAAMPLPEKARLRVQRLARLSEDPPTTDRLIEDCRRFSVRLSGDGQVLLA